MMVLSARTKTMALVLVGLAAVIILLYTNQITSGPGYYQEGGGLWRGGAASLSRHFFSNYQWKREFAELNGPDVSPNDPQVIKKIRTRFLISPSALPYNLSRPEVDDPSMGQAHKITSILQDMRKGFFVECGALDGETRSNTLYFERVLGWEGLLLEADPSNFAEVIWKQRKAWISPACLSIKNYPTMVSFEQKVNQGHISNYGVGYIQKGFVDIQCFPLYSFMLALNRTRIDYFSLDVEGAGIHIVL